MGITARGAWESVKRHFREVGVDVQNEEFTVVGVGDMSGDVFGNGMLLSPHIRLVAAFDHRHVFLDPNPDAATSFAERRRLFDLPRSSWAEYDSTLLSEGGGIYPRTLKSVPVSAAVATVLGIGSEAVEMPPGDLLQAILRAPVDLLWNGGIGTYVKASAESHADVGDRANDAIRVNGNDLRCRVVGEGGNLGLPSSAGSRPRCTACTSTPTPSTTPPASTPPTTRSTSRSCSTPSSRTASSTTQAATSFSCR
jgi:glutamate dehydrogenase